MENNHDKFIDGLNYIQSSLAIHNIWASDESTQITKDEKKMTDHLIEAIQTNYTTVRVKYDKNGVLYTFKVLRDLILEPGDLVLIESTRGFFRTVEVVSVDKNPDIDYEAPFEYKWIVSKVDLSDYQNIKQREQQILDKIEFLKRQQKQQSVIDASGLLGVHISNLQMLGKME
jgi:hypothetical protein